ncbi:ROK family protein [Candidatus Uhrbacteria bacterium]|nr:ROK family protein [Candidatus Uhrbacteria bacterium]
MGKKLFIGVDFGGTKIKSGLVNSRGTVLKSISIPTVDPKTGKMSVSRMFEAIDSVWDRQASAIGVGIAGMVDFRKGKLIRGPNLPKSWDNADIAGMVRKRYGRPVTVDNDARCFALGEHCHGAGKGLGDMVGLTIGTGVGSGLVLNGAVFRGHDNGAGEIGHMTVSGKNGPACPCGMNGHLESLVSGRAIVRRYLEKTGQENTPKEISEKSRKGDPFARESILETGYWLGMGLAAIAQVINPEIIVVGGGLNSVHGLLAEAKSEFRKAVPYRPLLKTKITRSLLGTDANVIGAAIMASDNAS